jgi:hypothetical protein
MLEKMSQSSGNVLGYKVIGKLTKEDYATVAADIEASRARRSRPGARNSASEATIKKGSLSWLSLETRSGLSGD